MSELTSEREAWLRVKILHEYPRTGELDVQIDQADLINVNVGEPFDICVRATDVIQQPLLLNDRLLYEVKSLQEELTRAGGRIAELEAVRRDAETWFNHFGYNKYGIAVKDDIPDYAPVEAAIRQARVKKEEP